MAGLVKTTGKKQADNVGVGPSTFTFASNVNAGNSVVVSIVHFCSTGSGGKRVASVTAGGTAATKVSEKAFDAFNFCEIWLAQSVAGGTANVSVTFSTGSTDNYITLSAEEWDNFSASATDQTGTGGPTTSSSPSVTSGGATSQADEVAYAAWVNGVGGTVGTITKPGTYTETFQELDASTHEGGAAAYRVLTATGSQTATWTTSGSSPALQWASCMATFKTTGSGGATRPVKMAGPWGGFAGASGGFVG